MSPERRDELVKRREQLKVDRQQASVDQSHREFLAALDVAGVVYELAGEEPLITWITDRFAVDQWSSIDWAKVVDWELVGEDRGASTWLTSLAERRIAGDPVIAVVYANSLMRCLSMRLSELIKHADTVIDFNWQTWVFDVTGDWIIEFHHDLGWRWGRAAFAN